jgi:hypothetical protein
MQSNPRFSNRDQGFSPTDSFRHIYRHLIYSSAETRLEERGDEQEVYRGGFRVY